MDLIHPGNLIYPALALRGAVIFPEMTFQFEVSRKASIKALDIAFKNETPVFMVAQEDARMEDPNPKDLYKIGTLCKVRQILRIPGNSVRVMVDGIERGRLVKFVQTEPYFEAEVEAFRDQEADGVNSPEEEAMIRNFYDIFHEYCNLMPRTSPELFRNILTMDRAGEIADYVTQNIPLRFQQKQEVLEELNPLHRLALVLQILTKEIEVLKVSEEVRAKLTEIMVKNQRESVLREQIQVIQTELGDDPEIEPDEYKSRIQAAKLPKEVEAKLMKEAARLAKMPFGAESGVINIYLDTVLELPWNVFTKERINITAARKVLDRDHYGLEKVKERILEFLAVRQMSPDVKGQILCLVGPPGVGKTSIAMGVAKALNRNLVRISLGGVHDEADIRGHRRTYVGAMPGRIITAMQQAGSMNPIIVMDEIDKLGRDSHLGNPEAALLEVLDPEQNSTFRDHFLEVPFDLSNVMFITTANTTDTISRPLLDRMEVIELPSYTDEEKVQIAKQHLIPKERKRHGLKAAQFKITDNAIRKIISDYTKESGVRILERQIASLCRKTDMRLISEQVKSVTVTERDLEEFLGPQKYHPERQVLLDRVGVVNGLAWTTVGGELLQVEVNVVPGTGKLKLTGNLGDVMKESAQAAMSYIRSRAQQWGLEAEFYKNNDVHVHFPEGAIPKDGPSAGITIATAIVSVLTGIPVKGSVAMTGEVTLRGRVLPIGGLREKTMAALRNGISTVILPIDNLRDLEEIDQTVRNSMHFIGVEYMDQVLKEALVSDSAKKEQADVPQPSCPAEETGESAVLPQ